MSKFRLAVLTASIDPEKTRSYWSSWREMQVGEVDYYCVWNAPDSKFDMEHPEPAPFIVYPYEGIAGVVPAFHYGLAQIDYLRALGAGEYDVIALFHDDLKIYEKGWDRVITDWFKSVPNCGLAGFGGARGLGSADIYTVPYSPFQLARVDFGSNLRDAEAHGRRIGRPEKSIAFDGFCQIGRPNNLLKWMSEIYNAGVIHHFYDGFLGALAYRDGWEAYTLPVSCLHAGGQTAVGNGDYQKWANSRVEGGDQGFWDAAHKIGYEYLRGILPLRVKE